MIEPATPEDLDAIVALGRLFHEESPRWRCLAYSPERVRATAQNLMDSPDGLVLVARRDGQLVGGLMATCAMTWASEEKIAREMVLFIVPEHRGSILAARLIAALVTWAKLRGARWVEAGVSTDVMQERSIALYHRLGFEPAGVGVSMEI